MRHIDKREALKAFESWKKGFKHKHGRKANYDDLGEESELKRAVKDELILEQYGLCCYCCKEIRHDKSHIEHFRPQVVFNGKTVDYNNLHASCNGNKGKNDHCGHKKGNWFDERLTVSPLEENCEFLFEYNFNGDIISANENQRAKETIDKLGLNQYALQTARAAAIISTGISESHFNEETRAFWIKYFEQIEESKVKQFNVAVLHCLNNYL